MDVFEIEKKFPDLEGGVTIMQDGPKWGETYAPHGYSFTDKKIWRKTFKFNEKLKPDQEVTIYVFLPSLNPEYGSHPKIGRCASGSGLSIKVRGSHHSDESDSSAKCYIFHYEYEGGICNNFQKEFPHNKYSKHDLPEEDNSPFPRWVGRVIGFKAALLNTNDGDNVEFWSWFDLSARVENGRLLTDNNWLLRYHGIDTGVGEGNFGTNGAPRTKPPFLKTHGKLTEFRMDNAPENTKAFCASVREIQRP